MIVLYSSFCMADESSLIREMIAHKEDSTFKYTFYYNENQHKTVEHKYFLKNNISHPMSRKEWVYENNLCVIQREQKWINGYWKIVYIINTNYNDGNKMSETYISLKDDISLVEKTITYTYNDDKLVLVNTYKGEVSEFNIQSSIVTNYNSNQSIDGQMLVYKMTDMPEIIQEYKYVYSNGGQLDSILVYSKVEDNLIPQSLTTFLYNRVNDKLSTQIQKKWNSESNKWENIAKNEFVYDLNNRIINEIFSHYNILFWITNSKYEYVYDAQGFLKEKVLYQPIYREWRRLYTISYSNVERGRPNLMESKYNFWGGETDSYVKNFIPYYFNDEMSIIQADKLELKYIIETSIVSNFELEKNKLNIYPNPSNGVFYVSTDNERIASWHVYNINGVIVKSNINKYLTGIIDLTDLPDGVYMIQAATEDNRILQQKILINRK